MTNEELDNFIEAGKIAGRIREESKSLIMVDEPLLDIAETIEKMIYDEGVQPAFPVNISINDNAAHYTPEFECALTLGENDVVKIDLGVAIEGAISDTAYTIDLSGKNENLVKASSEALDAALLAIKPGVGVGEIGGIIEDKIKSYGFKPISNLTGHMIKSNDLHAGVSVPNVRGTGDSYTFKVGDIFAIEPFATNGRGQVEDSEQVEIFSIHSAQPIRMRQSRQILQHVIEKYGVLPFAERWVRREFKSKLLVSAALKEMLEAGVLRGYPVLKEQAGSLVAQFEHTILIEENGARVLSK
ncbi:type II methionyl aminopeptidase [Candidatus Micrarchaeota archaeon]|nr:type II methionyl aminopeptidase [Candidatus Micrarchaeota archaeon]